MSAKSQETRPRLWYTGINGNESADEKENKMYNRTQTTGHFNSQDEALAHVPDGAFDVSTKMVDSFDLEQARANWPEPNPPAYPAMRAAAKNGIVEIWQVTYITTHRDQPPER